MNNKTIKVLILSFIGVFLVGIILFIIETQNKQLEKIKTEVDFYAVISEKKGPGYMVSATFDDEELINGETSLYVLLDDDLNIGDVVKIKANNDLLLTDPPRINLISYKIISKTAVPEIEQTIPELDETLNNQLENPENINPVLNENDVISTIELYIKEAQDHTNPGFTDKIKTNFITVMDFIFYESYIAGYKFSDLSSSAKIKVISLALTLDNIAESKIPGYKTTLSSSYKNGKEKLVTYYLEVTTDFCANNDPVCTSAKSDFLLLKKSLNLSWNFVSGLAKNSASKIKVWYEIFSGK